MLKPRGFCFDLFAPDDVQHVGIQTCGEWEPVITQSQSVQTNSFSQRELCYMQGEHDLAALSAYNGTWETIDDFTALQTGDIIELRANTVSSNADCTLTAGLQGRIRRFNDDGSALIFFPECRLVTLGEHWIDLNMLKVSNLLRGRPSVQTNSALI